MRLNKTAIDRDIYSLVASAVLRQTQIDTFHLIADADRAVWVQIYLQVSSLLRQQESGY